MDNKLLLNCYVETMEQFNSLLTVAQVDKIYLDSNAFDMNEANELIQKSHSHGKQLILGMPAIYRDTKAYKSAGLIENAGLFDGVLVRNIDELALFIDKSDVKLIADASLYTFNSIARELLDIYNIIYFTAPLEQNSRELKRRGCTGDEMLVYGYIQVMVSAQCIVNTTKGCTHIPEFSKIKDRKGECFTVINNCKFCYNTMYNSKPLSLLSLANEVKSLDFGSIRLNFTIEDGKETARIANEFARAYIDGYDVAELENYTRGHFKRGVE